MGSDVRHIVRYIDRLSILSPQDPHTDSLAEVSALPDEVLNQPSVYCRTERMQAIAQKIMYSGPCFCHRQLQPLIFTTA
jgi:hypothetical protein